MNYGNYLRTFGIHPCKVVFADKKADKFGEKYIITFEHTTTAARIDLKCELVGGKVPAEGFSRNTINNILKAVGVAAPKDLIGKELLVLVEPFEWEKMGKSGTMWSPKKFWNTKYAQYLPDTDVATAKAAFGNTLPDDSTDSIEW